MSAQRKLEPADANVANWSALLAAYRPRRLPGRHFVTRCGVVVMIAEHGVTTGDRVVENDQSGPAILMMRRAERAGDPWSGDVSFPGGKQDVSDLDTRATALRELAEETGFKLTSKTIAIGRLSDRLTREHGRNRPMVVSPYVYRTKRATRLTPGAEAAALIWVPVNHLMDPARKTRKLWRVGGVSVPAPAIRIDDGILWGLSLMMTNELLRVIGLTKR